MADTTFVNNVTLTDADWFNDLNRLHYTIFNDPADFDAVQTAILDINSGNFLQFQAGNPDLSGTTSTTQLYKYNVGSWTPALKFGGASTGITYGTQFGYFVRIGNALLFTVNIVLTNKGSATGAATITMPYTGYAAVGSPTVIGVAQLSNMTTAQPDCFWKMDVSGATAIELYNDRSTTGTPSTVTDTAFSNTSIITCTGTYFISPTV